MNITHKIRQIQQYSIQSCVNKTYTYSFFNLLTSPQLLDVIEEQLPHHRERLYPPPQRHSLCLWCPVHVSAVTCCSKNLPILN